MIRMDPYKPSLFCSLQFYVKSLRRPLKLSISLKVIPIGLAYAIWSGVGIVLTVIAGILIWRETLDWARVIGIIFIILGILIINLFSKITAH